MSHPVPSERQQRSFAIADLEMRTSAEDEEPRIAGYAAVFNQPSEIISDFSGVYREIIAPGALTQSLSGGADVRALVNHDPNFVLGRIKSETLSLRADTKGLWYEVTPPDTQWARDLMTTMRRGDIDQSSFAFRVVKDEWKKGKTAEGRRIDERTVLEAQLYDVSPVTYPAYAQTTSALRALLGDLDTDAFARACRDLPTFVAELRMLLDRLTASLTTEPAPPAHSDEQETEPAPSGHSVLRRVEPVYIDTVRADLLRTRLDRMARL